MIIPPRTEEPTTRYRFGYFISLDVLVALPEDRAGRTDEQHLADHFDRLYAALDNVPGVFVRGGTSRPASVEEMGAPGLHLTDDELLAIDLDEHSILTWMTAGELLRAQTLQQARATTDALAQGGETQGTPQVASRERGKQPCGE